MELDRGRSYPMYVLNLDNGRIFWLSLLFLIIFGLCFLLGLFFGKSNFLTKAPKTETSESHDVQYDNFLLGKMSVETQNNDFEFYKVLNKEKLSREDIEHSIPYKKSEIKKTQNVKVDNQYPEVQEPGNEKPGPLKDGGKAKKEPVPPPEKPVKKQVSQKEIESVVKPQRKNSPGGVNRPSSAVNRYSIQVASYVNNATAETFRQQISAKRYRAYIVQSHVNNQLYFRLRVGPFSSREKAMTVLGEIKSTLGYSGAYLCSN